MFWKYLEYVLRNIVSLQKAKDNKISRLNIYSILRGTQNIETFIK